MKRYKDEKWLRKKYKDEKLSTYQIAKICGVTYETIRRWLIKFNISRRSDSEAIHLRRNNHCQLSTKAIEWINGELLGDGNLESNCIYSAKFQYSSKHPEYINYVSNTLNSFGIKQSGKIQKICHKEGNISYHYKSRSYPELLSLYNKWYPENKKTVPRDIILTPLMIRQWLIGDGCMKYSKCGSPYIELYTCGFSISDVKNLVKKLTDLGFKVMRWAYHNSIGISTYSTKDFLNYIGTCPVKCYQYKFTVRGEI